MAGRSCSTATTGWRFHRAGAMPRRDSERALTTTAWLGPARANENRLRANLERRRSIARRAERELERKRARGKSIATRRAAARCGARAIAPRDGVAQKGRRALSVEARPAGALAFRLARAPRPDASARRGLCVSNRAYRHDDARRAYVLPHARRFCHSSAASFASACGSGSTRRSATASSSAATDSATGSQGAPCGRRASSAGDVTIREAAHGLGVSRSTMKSILHLRAQQEAAMGEEARPSASRKKSLRVTPLDDATPTNSDRLDELLATLGAPGDGFELQIKVYFVPSLTIRSRIYSTRRPRETAEPTFPTIFARIAARALSEIYPASSARAATR